ncbi:MAG: hypothetical protein DI533_19530 [Cereibacter sphaeroides]|uniref:Uncharacterized protein n=1 Tax=Cereibacter sphaeroides TaxID=1063 RepID=A0A2W5RXR6_CERSP|nr:MAG: hypothetical protein DI533_19530 [Cereibacter sphaeroides]
MRFLRTLIILVVLTAAAAFGAGLFYLDDKPAVARLDPPTPDDVAAARAAFHKIRQATDDADASENAIALPLETIQGALRMSARAIPGLRAETRIDGDAVGVSASVPVPWIDGTRWLNVNAVIPSFNGELTLSRVTLGGHDLPPALALRMGQIAANLALGDQTGDRIRDSASALLVQDKTLNVTLRLNREGRGEVVDGVFGALRNADMPAPEDIDRYYTLIRTAMDDGTLPASGSFLPYLRFTLNAALEGSTSETLPNAYTAAIFGLTRVCGARDFAIVVGRLAATTPAAEKRWTVDCTRLRLADRADSRLHFVTAAAIKAAGNRGLAISMGEFKEMSDSRQGGSKFDFTDIAADNSGVRFSDLFMAAPPEAWPDLIARIGTDADLIASYDGLPDPMPEDEFRATFGDVDSAAYAALMAEIEARIDQTALHATPAGG